MSPARSASWRASTFVPEDVADQRHHLVQVGGRAAGDVEHAAPRPARRGADAALKFASMMLSMWQKSRDCVPSPKMRGVCPASAAVMNLGITAAYSDFGSWRGPKTLK